MSTPAEAFPVREQTRRLYDEIVKLPVEKQQELVNLLVKTVFGNELVRPEVLAAAEASLKRNEAGYGYLADR